MATTEDIAEKVSDLLLEQTAKGGAFVTTAVPPAVSGIMQATSSTIRHLREQVKNDRDLRRLMGLEGEVSEQEMSEAIRRLGLASSTIHVADGEAKELAQLLQERKVLFAKVDKTDDNCKLFVFLTKDAEKVKEAVELMQARRGLVTELNPDLFFNSMQPERVLETAGLDDVELELFRHYARKEGLVFTVLPSFDGKHNVYFESGEQEKARKVLLNVGWMLSGHRRDLTRQQLEHRIQGRHTIQRSLEDVERELYVVSAANPASYVHITADDFTQYKNGQSVNRLSRERRDFAERCMASCDGLERPVVLAPDEFRTDLQATDLSRYPTMDFMSKGFEEARELEALNELIALVSRKSGLDNEHDSGVTLWDSSISFSDFAADEEFADADKRKRFVEAFDRLQDAIKYPKGEKCAMEELNMDQRSLDFIIERAEQKKRAQEASGLFRPRESERSDQQSL